MHDIGKYSEAFQKRLLEKGPMTDHATAGAQEMLKQANAMAGYCAAYCISGHHSGLLDGGTVDNGGGEATLQGRRKKTVAPYDILTAHVSIVFTRYMLLSVAQRRNEADKIICELFFCLTDEMEDITFSQSMRIIIDALMDTVSNSPLILQNYAVQIHKIYMIIM